MEMKGGMKIKQMLKEMEASNRVVLLYVMRLLRLVSLNQEVFFDLNLIFLGL